MSFLAEVLSSAKKVEMDGLVEKVPKVNAEVTRFKNEVNKYLDNVYVMYAECPRQNKQLDLKARQLKDELLILDSTVKDVVKQEVAETAANVRHLKLELEKSVIAITIIENIVLIHNGLQTVREFREKESLVHGMTKILELCSLAESVLDDEKTEALRELILKIKSEKELILITASNMFTDNVIMSRSKDCSMIKVNKNPEKIRDCLMAFFVYKSNIEPLDEVVKFLWNSVFTTIVDNCVVIDTNVDDDFNTLKVVISKETRPHYKEVFKNFKKVTTYLMKNLDFTLDKNFSTLNYMGASLRDNIAELIIKRCLEHTIPSTKDGLENFKEVIEDTNELQSQLVKSKLFDEDTCSIIEYAKKIDILFINNMCHEHLYNAIELMKKDLHDMTEVGTLETSTAESTETDFPLCMVSKSCLDLLRLSDELLQHCADSSEVCAGRLLCTIQNIFDEYKTVVPEYHQKLLHTIPQQVALFHNNCMYIAYTISKWKPMLKKLPPTITTGPIFFEEQQHELQNVAKDTFHKCVVEQKNQINQILAASSLYTSSLSEELPDLVEKCIRQCLRQQELLKTVWHRVLSYRTYNKSLGMILDSFCSALITPILNSEDIASVTARQLVDMYKVVLVRAPKVFTDPNEVQLFAVNWKKLQELVFVLNSGLNDICERWADNKGPLAFAFSAEEVRGLIKALFQNTDRRAQVLTRIHDV